MIVDGITIESSEHLEIVIASFSDESKIALRLIFAEAFEKGLIPGGQAR